MTLLKIEGLTKYFGSLRALTKVDLNVNKGEIVSLIGPNGSGKTTLINCVTGFYRPDEGRVIFKGENITGLMPYEIARKGIVRTYQITQLFADLSVFENVLIGLHLRTKTGILGAIFFPRATLEEERQSKRRALEILEFMELIHLKDALAKNLPIGYQKRLGLAIAMATSPELLLLDEPASGLNPEETNRMMALLNKIRDLGTTILLVEHNMRVVMKISDRVVVLNYGNKIAEGSPREVRENKDVIEAYLGREYFA